MVSGHGLRKPPDNPKGDVQLRQAVTGVSNSLGDALTDMGASPPSGYCGDGITVLEVPRRYVSLKLRTRRVQVNDRQVMNCVNCLFSQKRCDGRDATREGSAETNRSQCGVMVLFLLS